MASDPPPTFENSTRYEVCVNVTIKGYLYNSSIIKIINTPSIIPNEIENYVYQELLLEFKENYFEHKIIFQRLLNMKKFIFLIKWCTLDNKKLKYFNTNADITALIEKKAQFLWIDKKYQNGTFLAEIPKFTLLSKIDI